MFTENNEEIEFIPWIEYKKDYPDLVPYAINMIKQMNVIPPVKYITLTFCRYGEKPLRMRIYRDEGERILEKIK